MQTKKIKQKIKNLIIAFVTAMILLNSVIPSAVFADKNRVDTMKILLEGELSEDEIKQLDDFIDILNKKDEELEVRKKDGIENAKVKDAANKSKEEQKREKNKEYTKWLKETIIPDYQEHYKPFLEAPESLERIEDENFDKEKKIYNPEKKGHEGTEQVRYKDYFLPQIRYNYKKYLRDNVEEGEEAIEPEDKELSEEEVQEIQDILGVKEIEFSFLGPMLGTIARCVVGICDGIMNILQGFMLPGSPKAVRLRPESDKIKEMYDKIDTDYSFIAFKKLNCIFMANGENKYSIEKVDPSALALPLIYYSPIAIFSNRIPALDINFIDQSSQVKNPFVIDENGGVVIDKSKELLRQVDSETKLLKGNGIAEISNDDEIAKEEQDLDEALADAQGENKANVARSLQDQIAKWYVALRVVAVVGLLIVLVYLGIRILISVAADEEARYKKMLKDWVMALLLVFLLHYIMLALITVANSLSRAISSGYLFIGSETRTETK